MILVFQQATSHTYDPSGLAWAAMGVTIASLAITVLSSGAYTFLTRSARKRRIYDLHDGLMELRRTYPVRNVEELSLDEMRVLTSTLEEFLDTPLLPSLSHSKTKAAMNKLLGVLKPFEEKPPDLGERT
ncbi:MAG TPA: hypothetical protein VEV41_01790 [Terriglobales bacterium]|nr:hypothetical protein [Terriglobales bacterium]